MDNGQRSGNPPDAALLQQALRAFGASSNPAQSAELAALAQRMGLQTPPTTVTGNDPTEAPRGPQFVVMALGTTEMAMAAAHVVGVERVGDITPVPHTLPWVLGVANLRGAITSVVDLRLFLGLPFETITSRSRVVVASAKEMIVGFLVDGVTEFRALPPEAQTHDHVRQLTPPWLTPYVETLAIVGDRRILLIDVEKLLFADSLHRYRADL
jgi:purine-binding chemotaxis protein CheW